MKKLLASIASIVVVSFLLVGHVSAQKDSIQQIQTTGEVESVQSAEVEYALPYPGILSDHPLYFLKKIRDSLMRAFLNDPIKKIEFSLLQSDKFLGMAMSYADKKNWVRAGETVVLSQKEMERAISEVVSAQSSGTKIPANVIGNLELSAVKHKERADIMMVESQEESNGLFGKASVVFSQLAAQVSGFRDE
jgi:hypothetical protein